MSTSKVTLYVTEFGATLRKRGNRFLVLEEGGDKQEIAACDVNRIIVPTRGSSISTDAIFLALENRIPVLMAHRNGKPVGRIASLLEHGTTALRQGQYDAISNGVGRGIARELVLGKIINQSGLLARRALNRKESSPLLAEELDSIVSKMRRIFDTVESLSDSGVSRDGLRGAEGSAASLYWSGIAKIIPERYSFEERETRGAKDLVNCMLNYGYAILRSEVLVAVTEVGLDPFAGFLHSPRPGRPSCILDAMEEMRPVVVDAPILNLLVRKQIPVYEFRADGRLDKTTREAIVESLTEELESQVVYDEERTTLRRVIAKQAQLLASSLRSAQQDFSYYKARW